MAIPLAALGWTAPWIARHLGLDRTTVHRDLRRWLERGIEGLFHRSRAFREAAGRWRERGLEVAYLPRYSLHLNLVESVWRRVKGFLMPRRHYGSVEELREAVAEALERLRERMGQGVLQSLCVGT